MAKKRILFLHPNFPAQFKHICGEYAREHEVYFICQTHFGRKIPNVKRLTLKGSGSAEFLEENTENQKSKAELRGLQYRNAFVKLENQNWKPDIIICHSGWGCGLYAREIWNDSKIISYVEWWFCPNSKMFFWDKENPYLDFSKEKVMGMWSRNQQQALEIISSDKLVSPTHWQKSQLPKHIRNNCEVIFDGIDITEMSPYTKRHKEKKFIITYGTRGMEPMRGFPDFIKSLPALLKKNDNILVKIAGEDKVNYGGLYPEGFTSWKTWAINQLEKENISEKVIWLGYLDKYQYKDFLNESSCHIYFSQPFIASWSLIDAISMNCTIIASDNETTREFEQYKTRPDQLVFVDHRNINAIYSAIYKIITERISAGQYIKERDLAALNTLSKQSVMNKWKELIVTDR